MHLGEMTIEEIRSCRAGMRWANAVMEGLVDKLKTIIRQITHVEDFDFDAAISAMEDAAVSNDAVTTSTDISREVPRGREKSSTQILIEKLRAGKYDIHSDSAFTATMGAYNSGIDAAIDITSSYIFDNQREILGNDEAIKRIAIYLNEKYNSDVQCNWNALGVFEVRARELLSLISSRERESIEIPVISKEWCLNMAKLEEAAAPKRESVEETGWVIEHIASEPCSPDYFCGYIVSQDVWQKDHNKALRFARRRDAEIIRDTLLSGGCHRLAEHSWSK